MRKLFYLFLLVFLSACGLNSSQEKSLNIAVAKYLMAVNSDLKLSRAAATHPEVLKYYKSKGHNAFKEYFEKETGIWQDAVIGKMDQEGTTIHVELKLLNSEEMENNKSDNRFSIYAISSDNGNSWFFVEEKDYNSKLCGTFKRLIK